jgi:undecaprenyl-diphosphatase
MKKRLYISLLLLAAFILWTSVISVIDVQPIGPDGSTVGFATLNGSFHALTGVNMMLYAITDWLGLVPVFLGMGFAVLGAVQWFQRKSISKVDFSILVLGGSYVVVLAAYLLFEEIVVNYRPVLIEGFLEASYPSSTTLLVLCIMPTTRMQLKERIRNHTVRKYISIAITVFTCFMVVGRLISGVHWLTDIIGGTLLSGSLVTGYQFVCELKQK